MKILVSACLLGEPCRYDGKSKPCQSVIDLMSQHELIPICPEVLGGLSTPRTPCEIQGDGTVKSRDGRDASAEYALGAQKALQIALQHGCRLAILKERSPSCGSGAIYDGSFSQILKRGDGITTTLLKQNGITVIGERDLEDKILKELS